MKVIWLVVLIHLGLSAFAEDAANSGDGSGEHEFLDVTTSQPDWATKGEYHSGSGSGDEEDVRLRQDGFIFTSTTVPQQDWSTQGVYQSGDGSGSGEDGAQLGQDGFIFSSTAAPQEDWSTQEVYQSGDGSGEDDAQLGADGFIFSSTAVPPQVPEPTLKSYHIISTVTARYVSTSVLVTVVNTANVSQEVPFNFKISEQAFISSYVMTIDGVPYEAEVKEKVAAQKAYNEAKNQGRDASQVKQKDKDNTRFLVDLNLAAQSTVVFNLTYQELLRRDKGQFKHRINVAPGQVVDDIWVDVYILEPQGITSLNSTWISDESPLAPLVSFQPLSTQANVLLNPSISEQSELGIVGVLQITYDVQHDLNGGDIQISNGYFVHYFSPEGIPPAPKKVVFVIDVSGSMYGSKIRQTQEVMVEILSQLRDIDFFNVLVFSHSVRYWRQHVVQATKENIQSAQEFVHILRARGGTNIYNALLASIGQFNNTDEAFPAIFFLTDGRGSSTADRLSTAVKENANQKIALFTIGFGLDVDGPLLEQLAVENQGLYRQILIDSNAGLEMQGFFEEFATPLLFNINVQYEDNAVDTTSLTDKKFISYFDGKELMVAGKISEEYTGGDLKAVVTAKGREQIQLRTTKEIGQVDPEMIEDFAQRLWAYMKIKDILAREKVTRSKQEKDELKQRALVLSLRYSFVTPLTSLLVIKPRTDGNDSTTQPEDTLQDDPAAQANQQPQQQPRPQPQAYLARRQTLQQAPLARPQLQYLQHAPPVSPQMSPLLHAHIGRPQAGPSGPVGSYRGGPSRSGLSGGAYGDPHIVIHDARTDLKICFDIHGPSGTVVNLLDDPNIGITVNGEMVETETEQTLRKPNKIKPTYFRRMVIQVGDDWIVVTCDTITVNREDPLYWTGIMDTNVGACKLTIRNGTTTTITCAHGIVMKVSLDTTPDKLEHLDFFLAQGGAFSSNVNGIVGQFQRRQMALESSRRVPNRKGKEKAKLLLDGEDEIPVYKVSRKRIGDCWTTYVHKNLPILEMSYLKYILMDIFEKPDYELNL